MQPVLQSNVVGANLLHLFLSWSENRPETPLVVKDIMGLEGCCWRIGHGCLISLRIVVASTEVFHTGWSVRKWTEHILVLLSAETLGVLGEETNRKKYRKIFLVEREKIFMFHKKKGRRNSKEYGWVPTKKWEKWVKKKKILTKFQGRE